MTTDFVLNQSRGNIVPITYRPMRAPFHLLSHQLRGAAARGRHPQHRKPGSDTEVSVISCVCVATYCVHKAIGGSGTIKQMHNNPPV